MDPSLGSARILSKKLGSARAIFQKARIEKIGKNEPILGLETVTNLKTTKKIKICFEIELKDQFFSLQ